MLRTSPNQFVLRANDLPPQRPGDGFPNLRVYGALVLREMATTYGRSPGGWLWSILEPVAAIGLLAFAFSLAFQAPPLGASFALFYATGFLPYMLFHDLSQKVALAVRFSKPLLNFGAVTLVDTCLARLFLCLLTHVTVISIVLFALIVFEGSSQTPDAGSIALALAMATALACGTGLTNCYLFSAFPAWERLWNIGLRPLFIISGVVFLMEDAPYNLQPWLNWNPLFHVTGAMREGFYQMYTPDYVSACYVFGVSAALCAIGLLLLDRFGDELVHK